MLNINRYGLVFLFITCVFPIPLLHPTQIAVTATTILANIEIAEIIATGIVPAKFMSRNTSLAFESVFSDTVSCTFTFAFSEFFITGMFRGACIFWPALFTSTLASLLSPVLKVVPAHDNILPLIKAMQTMALAHIAIIFLIQQYQMIY